MIIDFTVSNFHSFKERQTFSLFAESTSSHLSDNVANPNGGEIGVLRTAGIYGANASGKSNFLLALQALRYIICNSGDLKDGDFIPCYEPYLLAKGRKNAPIEFEIEFFSKEDIRFVYSVTFDARRIISESLSFYPSRSPAKIFQRNEGEGWDNISFGTHYKGGKKKFAFFDNNSYLSKAGNSADAPKLIRTVFNYFWHDVFHLGVNQQVGLINWQKDEGLVKSISSILSMVDTGITDVSFKERDTSEFKMLEHLPDDIKKQIMESEKLEPLFAHDTEEGGRELFTEDMESAGTIKLFKMLPILIDALREGGVLVIDELDNSFHTHIAELIITLFNDPSIHKKNAQLIFSTHNISLMNPELLRRDQIWLTKKTNGESVLCCLDGFDKSTVKMDSPFGKWYGDGRFGAIPTIDVAAITEVISNRSS